MIRTSNGHLIRFGDGTGTPISIHFKSRKAEWSLLRDPDMKIGELFMDGELEVKKGTIYDFVHLIMSNASRKPPAGIYRAIDWVRSMARRINQRNSGARSKQNVAHHYDLDAGLYRLFLDTDMQYSCAYFESCSQSLEDAQLAKKRHIAAKLHLEEGQSVLDIGCGWGGMALYLAQTAGAEKVHGITLSEEQIKIARARAKATGISTRTTFELIDYRSVEGKFDRLVSVGMFEHVGVPYYNTFFTAARRLMTEDGVFLLHTIGCSDSPGFVTPWINKYIFPGGYIPSLSEIVPSIEHAGLIISDVEILQLHYAWTLRAWRERFMAKREEAARIYDERFCRMWEFYLASAEAAFRCERLNVFQIQITRKPAVVPPNRNYISQREEELRARERVLARAA